MKKVISLFLSLAMLLSIVSVVDFSAYASVKTGKCGDNVTYSLDTSTGELTISGTGKMTDYSGTESPFDHNSNIKSLIIENGVTSIGVFAFYGCESLTSVTIPDSVTSIGRMAFYYTAYYNDESNWNNGVLYISDCLININDDFDSTTDYIIKDGTRIIADSAFYNSENLISVTIPDSVTSIDESAFENCTRLASIDVEKDNSYYSSQDGVLFNKDKTELIQYPAGNKRTTYDIPNSVKSIGSSAFENCTSLASVTIPNSVTSIGSSAFSGCSNLKSVNYNGTKAQWKSINGYSNIPIAIICTDGITGNGSVVTIDNLKYKIYDDTASLVSYTGSSKNFVIPESVTYEGLTFKVTSIGDYAFYNCTSLTSVTIPNSVESIGDNAFRDCSSLTSITIPDSVTNIGNNAFSGCSSLTSVTIPNSVTSISWHAFRGCGRLTSITIPNSVTSIGDYAFRNCTSLKSVNYSGTKSQWKAITIGSNNYDLTRAFIKCTDGFIGNGNTVTSDNLKYEIYDDTVSLVSYTGSAKNLVISKNISYKGYTLNVTSIGKSAFKGCTSLTSVTIPDSVTSIGDHAFYGCTNLTSVTIGNSVTSIGSSAFYGCTNLTSVTIGNSVTSIGSSAFYGCTSLTSVTIPDSVTSIGSYAFEGCTSLTSVNYSGTKSQCKSIEGYYNISKIIKCTDGIVGNGNTVTIDNLKYKIYDDTASLVGYTDTPENLIIPESVLYEGYTVTVTGIGDEAFYNCTSLTSITIPNSVTSIGSSAFSGCTSLTSVTIPNSVESIGDNAFQNCSSLTSATIGNNVTSIGSSAFFGCSKLKKIEIPDSVTYIGSKAFDGTAFYNTVKNWEDGVLYCGNHLISAKSDVTKITVKASTVSIAAGALDNCKSLEKINVLNPKCVINCTIPKTTVIGGAEGSTAEDFAQKNNMSIDYFEECIHSDKVQVVIAATCTEQGAVQSRCADCDKLISQTFTAPLGHTMVITTPAKAPTCTTSGNTQAGYCTVCGYNEVSTVIPATGHNFGNNSPNCLVCGVANPNYVAPAQPTQTSKPVAKPKSAKIKKVKAAKKAIAVEWKKVSGVNGYEIQVATDKKFKKNKKTVTIKKQKTTKTTVKKLKAKKKYYVRIRTYKIVNGKKVYSSWSKVKSVKTK